MTKKARARSSSRKRVSRYSNIVSTQRPPIAIRASSASAGVRSSSASEIGPAKGSAISAAIVASQKSAAKEVGDDPRRVLAVLVVEAQQRLDQAEADDDAGRDDRGEHHLGGAVVGRWSGSACRAAAARPRSASRGCSPRCRRRRSSPGGAGIPTRAEPMPGRGPRASRQRSADRQQHPSDRVLEEAGVGHRVDEQGDEGGEDGGAGQLAGESADSRPEATQQPGGPSSTRATTIRAT